MTTDSYKDPHNSKFMGLVNISDEMTQFLGWKQGEPRTKVDAKFSVLKYIEEHDLMDGYDIHPDENLKRLLKCNEVFNINEWVNKMEQHFTPIQN